MNLSFGQDLIFSVRSLRRSLGLTIAVIALLALGVGANVATFAVADQLFLRPPSGVTQPSAVTRLYLETQHTEDRSTEIDPTIEFAAYTEIARSVGASAPLAAYTTPDSAFVGIGSTTRVLRAVYATPNYFSVLGARMALGRVFTDDESRMGAGTPVAVISYDTWQRQFSGDSAVLGKTLDVALARYTIVGVTARDFDGPDLDRSDLWLPIAMRPGRMIGDAPWYDSWRSGSYVRMIGRPRPGIAAADIAAAATAVFRRGERDHVQRSPDTTATLLAGPILEALGPSITPPVERAITSRLLGVAMIVLLVACANVANLLLLRGVRRRREIAIRLSLGISRARLMRQLLTESVLLSLVAAAVAIALAEWFGGLLRVMILPSVHWADGPIHWPVIVAAIGVALASGVASGLAPAWRAGRTDLAAALKTGARDGGEHGSRLRAGLVIAQVGLSMVLLCGAGLFVRSLAAVHNVNVGYDVDRLVYGTVQFRNPQERYVEFFSYTHADELSNGLEAVAAKMRANRDVESVAVSSAAPMEGYVMVSVKLGDGSAAPRVGNRDPALIAAEPSYFRTTGVKLLRGRFFTDADQASGAPVIVVNETAARTYWPGHDALGQCLSIDPRTPACLTVIGIARDAHLSKIVETPSVEMFTPIARSAGFLSHPTRIVVRAMPGSTDRVAAALRRELARQFPLAELPDVTSAADARAPELRPWQLGATLFSIFGALALLVASLGVYSTLAYAVGQRLHEMGIRIALGARGGQIMRLVLASGMRSLVAGVACGLGATLFLGRFVASMLYGTRVTNPLVLGGAAAVLLLAGAVGCIVPAARAMRVDPATALRAE